MSLVKEYVPFKKVGTQIYPKVSGDLLVSEALGSGVGAAKFLRGDQTWQVVVTEAEFTASIAHLTTDAEAGKAFTVASFPLHGIIKKLKLRADFTSGQQTAGSALVNVAAGVAPAGASIGFDSLSGSFIINDYCVVDNELMLITGVGTDAAVGKAFSYNANTAAFTDETTDINNATANDVVLPPIQVTTDGDAIYFGHLTDKFRKITVNVGTAKSVTGGTYAWQYWNGSAWTALSGLTDNTTFFGVAGTNTVTFTEPSNWATTDVNAITAYWIRAVATARPTEIATAPLGTQAWLDANILTVTRAQKGTVAGYHDDNAQIVKANNGIRLVIYKDSTKKEVDRVIELNNLMSWKGVTDALITAGDKLFGLTADIKNVDKDDTVYIDDATPEEAIVQNVNHDVASATYDFTVLVKDSLAAHAITKEVYKQCVFDIPTPYKSAATTLYGTLFVDEAITATVNATLVATMDKYT